MRIALNKRTVTTAQPRDRPYELRDTQVRGLLLRVQPSGHKAWIVTWAHGKRRTLGSAGHLSLDQARAHARHAKVKPSSPLLRVFLTDRYAPWTRVELRGGRQYVERIEVVFAGLLDTPLADFDAALIDNWWRERLTTPIEKTGNPLAGSVATSGRVHGCFPRIGQPLAGYPG